jgi:hypothetical protein
MNMKLNLLAAAIFLGAAVTASAGVYNYESGPLNATLTDGEMFPYSNTINVSGNPDSLVTDVNVTLNFSGGYNSDLYGYLVHDNVTVILLNRIGITTSDPFGNTSAGFSLTLSDGNTDIHTLTSLGAGPYGADGRDITPLSSGATFDATTRQNGGNPLGLFNDLNPNGNWVLYFADVASTEGGTPSVLNSWSLDITAVPEPTTWALIIFGTLGGGVGIGKLVRRRLRPAGNGF